MLSFNTTIVSVERSVFYLINHQERFSFNTTIVSVEQMIKKTCNTKKGEFQYNHCFGGTNLLYEINLYGIRFQYNHCFGGTDLSKNLDDVSNRFQYNHCFGGTNNGTFWR